MGQTLQDWKARVEMLVRDRSNTDTAPIEVISIGILPALARYSKDRPYRTIVEVAGAGSAYFDVPAGWSTGFSTLEAVEYPARENPPSMLDPMSWRMVRKTTDVTVEQILLSSTPSATEYVRFTFTAPWPTPDGTATTDKVDAVAFHAVTALAASLCLMQLVPEAARGRSGAIPSDFTDGQQRARSLIEAAKEYKAIYEGFLGISTGGVPGAEGGGGSGIPPASRAFDFDPGRDSLFHGGRR